MIASPLSPIPDDTFQSAQEAYGSKNLYVIFGNQAEFLLKDLDWSGLSPTQSQPRGYMALLATVSLFQYAEGLNDRQAESATRQRLDWKYALHLPLAYPGVAPLALCLFRQRLATYPTANTVFETLIHKMAELSFFNASPECVPDTTEVITVNCLRSCLDRSTSTLLQAIEGLASEQPAWLRQIAQPHWYTRYMAPHGGTPQASSRDELLEALRSLFKDMRHMVDAINSQTDLPLKSYPEVAILLQVWGELTGTPDGTHLSEATGVLVTVCAGASISGLYNTCPINLANSTAIKEGKDSNDYLSSP